MTYENYLNKSQHSFQTSTPNVGHLDYSPNNSYIFGHLYALLSYGDLNPSMINPTKNPLQNMKVLEDRIAPAFDKDLVSRGKSPGNFRSRFTPLDRGMLGKKGTAKLIVKKNHP
ncbi:hypothetical protein OsJ_33866 [Oryza sativa Japonica Group]|uniref:Uncharacterized protein n=1 Tax=Oryza sativa subsp. japonica TaxID=39947 RepID=B9GAM9_ORYSJ|nr:hypothetical protein OsJ_33866 [Oryza sativa Japonica Group]